MTRLATIKKPAMIGALRCTSTIKDVNIKSVEKVSLKVVLAVDRETREVVEDRKAKHHGHGKAKTLDLDRKAHGHSHKGKTLDLDRKTHGHHKNKRSADLDRAGHHGHKGSHKMAEERKAKHHGAKH